MRVASGTLQGPRDVTTSEHRRNPKDDPFVRRICALRPELGTALGLVEYGGALPTPGADARDEVLAANLAWRAELEVEAADSKDRLLDARVFSASLELQRFVDEDLAAWRHDPDDIGPVADALLLQLQGPVPEVPAERFVAIERRLRGLRGWLLRARQAAESEPAFAPSTELAIRARDVIDGMPDLLRAIADGGRAVGAVSPDGAAPAGGARGGDAPLPPSLIAALDAAVDDASGALDEHRDWLTSLSTAPHGPIGVERYDEILRLRGLDLTASEVLDLGRSVAEEMRVESGRLLRRHFKDQDAQGALAIARKNVPLTLFEATAWTRQLVDEARSFVADSGVIPLPAPALGMGDEADERLVVDAMPATLSPLGQAAVYMPPPPYAARQQGLLLLREPLGPQQEALKELSVADLEVIVASHALPGRHGQAFWQNRATTLARRGALSGIGSGGGPHAAWGLDMVHGWGLVCAELMRELAFRPSPAAKLLTVRQTLVAALVAVVDVDLALGRMRPEEAADLLVRRASLRLPVARALVRSLLKAPTTGLSALVGKVRIEQLRREAHKRWRGGYSDKRFHALLLTNGAIPLAYLFERLDEPPGYVTDVVTTSTGI
jgi:hypothetical protein